MFSGLRGVGKTAVLNHLRVVVSGQVEWVTIFLEASSTRTGGQCSLPAGPGVALSGASFQLATAFLRGLGNGAIPITHKGLDGV